MPTPSNRPTAGDYPPDFERYIRLVPEGNILEILAEHLGRLEGLLLPLHEAAALVVHPPYTWTLKQVLGHIVDCERVFGYRALRLARNDATPLPGFDEMLFMQFADFNSRPMSELLEEFACVRRGHLLLLNHLTPTAWDYRGTVLGHAATCRALAYVMAGHCEHHLAIIKKRVGGR